MSSRSVIFHLSCRLALSNRKFVYLQLSCQGKILSFLMKAWLSPGDTSTKSMLFRIQTDYTSSLIREISGSHLTPDEEKAQKQLEFFVKSFELERGSSGRDEKIESVVKPNLCPCCVNYANIRIQQMAHNPLTAILADAAQRSLSLIVSCDSPCGRFTTQLRAADIYRDQEFLVAKGNNRIFFR